MDNKWFYRKCLCKKKKKESRQFLPDLPQSWQELSTLSCSIRLQWVPGHSFLRETTQLMSLPDGERCLHLPQSLVVSLPLPLVSTLVFSGTGGVLSLPNILAHRFPQIPLRNLCSLVMLAVSSLVFPAMDTAFF